MLRQLGEAQQAQQGALPADATAAPCGQPGICTAVNSSAGEPSPPSGSGGTEAPSAALQLAAWLEAAASGSSSGDGSSSGGGGSSGSGQAATGGRWVPTLAAAMASSLRASPGVLASLRSLTPAQMLELYDTVLARVTELLRTVEATGSKAAEQQLTDLLVEAVSGPGGDMGWSGQPGRQTAALACAWNDTCAPDSASP